MNPNKKEDASYLQTVGRALTILEMFRQQNTLSLPSIARELGVGKTIAYRLVHTLTEEGFLIQDPFTKQYSLGEQVLDFVRCIGWMLNELLTIFFGISMSAPRSALILLFRVGIRVCVWIVWFQIILGV